MNFVNAFSLFPEGGREGPLEKEYTRKNKQLFLYDIPSHFPKEGREGRCAYAYTLYCRALYVVRGFSVPYDIV